MTKGYWDSRGRACQSVDRQCPQQIIKTQFRNSVVCLFGVLLYILYHCPFIVQWQTTKTMKLLKKQSLSNSSKREDMENKWQNPEKKLKKKK